MSFRYDNVESPSDANNASGVVGTNVLAENIRKRNQGYFARMIDLGA